VYGLEHHDGVWHARSGRRVNFVTESQKLEQDWETPPIDDIPPMSRAHVQALRASDDDAVWISGGQVLVLVHTIGRHSGTEHVVPLPIWRDADGHRIVVASFAGAPHNPDWLLNIRNRKELELLVEVQGGRYWSVPEILEGEDRRRVWEQLTADRAWYLDYQARTGRQIPLVRLPETRPA
jgi:deazaflavin-dependent oxidoreductase (nitroreductase family)